MPTQGAALYLSVLRWVHIFVPESLTLLRAGCEFLVEYEPVHYLYVCGGLMVRDDDAHERLNGRLPPRFAESKLNERISGLL